jgi:hypothetical protein
MHKFKTISLDKYFSVFILSFAIIILSAGCQKKAEQPVAETVKKDTAQMVTPVQPKVDTTAKVDTTKKYPDLTGTWTGTYQSHGATLKITEQNGEKIKGSLFVSTREPINKMVSGTFNLKTNKITMRDAAKSRYEASYDGKLSVDMKKISGTSYFIVDKNTVNFSFTKK